MDKFGKKMIILVMLLFFGIIFCLYFINNQKTKSETKPPVLDGFTWYTFYFNDRTTTKTLVEDTIIFSLNECGCVVDNKNDVHYCNVKYFKKHGEE